MSAEFSNPDMFALVEIGGEPRVRDIEIGERLGMVRPTNIRQVIEANRAEIEGFGMLHAAHATSPMPNGGSKKVLEFHLNEEQALCVSTLSNAPRAPEVRAMLIRTFTAFRRGLLVSANEPFRAINAAAIVAAVKEAALVAFREMIPAIVPEILNAIVPKLTEQVIEARVAADKRVAVLHFRSTLEILKEHGIPQTGRRGFVTSMTASLKDFCLKEGGTAERCPHSGKWLFPAQIVPKWWRMVGQARADEYLRKKFGPKDDQGATQGSLKLVVKNEKPKKDGAA